jgi:hypothetical protein
MRTRRPARSSSTTDRRVDLEEVVVIALAAQRLARAISTDEITAPLRDRLDTWAASAKRGRATGVVAGRLADLVRCPVCTGWWTSLAMSASWPGGSRLRRGVAVAGAQVLLTLAERLVSEQGRAAVHHADITEARNKAVDDGSLHVAAVAD